MECQLTAAKARIAELERDIALQDARLSRSEDELQEWKDDAEIVLAEKCATDEKHCGCVVHLRRRIKELEAVVGKLPRTADGIPWASGELWFNLYGETVSTYIRAFSSGYVGWDSKFGHKLGQATLKGTIAVSVCDGYSTREAALAAKGGA